MAQTILDTTPHAEVRSRHQAAIADLIAAAEAIEADLQGNADNRLRGGYVLVKEARVRWLLKACRRRRQAALGIADDPVT